MSDLFHEKAADWDGQTIVQQLSQTIGPSIIKHVDLHSEMEVMDFGAGTGLLSTHIVPRVKSVAAVDISKSMLNQLTHKDTFKNKVTTYCQNILEHPIDKKFDLIISAMAMHHVEDTALMLRRFSEHLKPGARIALADLDTEDGSFHPPHTQGVFHLGFDRATFTSLLEDAGFQNIQFFTAHSVKKDSNEFPIFLVLGEKV